MTRLVGYAIVAGVGIIQFFLLRLDGVEQPTQVVIAFWDTAFYVITFLTIFSPFVSNQMLPLSGFVGAIALIVSFFLFLIENRLPTPYVERMFFLCFWSAVQVWHQGKECIKEYDSAWPELLLVLFPEFSLMLYLLDRIVSQSQ